MLAEEEKRRVEHLEPFDEYEEWNLTCGHYMLLAAYKGDCCQLQKYVIAQQSHTPSDCDAVTGEQQDHVSQNLQQSGVDHENHSQKCDTVLLEISWRIFDEAVERFKMFSHTVNCLGNGIILCVGGFGERDKKHGRIKDVVLYSTDTKECIPVKLSERKQTGSQRSLVERLYHSCTLVDNGNCVIIGGRTSPIKPCTTVVRLSVTKSRVGELQEETVQHAKVMDLSGEGQATIETDMTSCTCDVTEVIAEEMQSDGEQPRPRWRHTATRVVRNGKKYDYKYMYVLLSSYLY